MTFPIMLKFGRVTASEIEVMLEASADSGSEIAKGILDKKKGTAFLLDRNEAEYLRDEMYLDTDRVCQGVGSVAGYAFERGADRLANILEKAAL